MQEILGRPQQSLHDFSLVIFDAEFFRYQKLRPSPTATAATERR